MTKKDIMPKDNKIIDLDTPDRNKKNLDKEPDDLEEYLKNEIEKIKNDRRMINIPLDADNQLDTSNGKSKYEALQIYILKRYSYKVIDKAFWEVSQSIKREEQPEIVEIEALLNRAEHSDMKGLERRNIIYKYFIDNHPLKQKNEIDLKIWALSELYYSIHEEAIKRAYRKVESLENRLLREELNFINSNKVEDFYYKIQRENEAIPPLKNKIISQENELKAFQIKYNNIEAKLKDKDKDLSRLKDELNNEINKEYKLKSDIKNLQKLKNFREWIKYKINRKKPF